MQTIPLILSIGYLVWRLFTPKVKFFFDPLKFTDAQESHYVDVKDKLLYGYAGLSAPTTRLLIRILTLGLGIIDLLALGALINLFQ